LSEPFLDQTGGGYTVLITEVRSTQEECANEKNARKNAKSENQNVKMTEDTEQTTDLLATCYYYRLYRTGATGV